MVLGAVGCMLIFFKLPNALTVNWAAVFVLAASCWLIYIGDRLLDNQSNPTRATTERHYFHNKHKKSLRFLSAFLFVFIVSVCFWLPSKLLLFGLVLAIIIAVYLIWVYFKLKGQSLHWFKDVFTALIFTLGVGMVPLLLKAVIPLSSWLVLLSLFLVAYQNLLCFSFFEKLEAGTVGKSELRGIRILLVTQILLVSLFFFNADGILRNAAFLFLFMSLVTSFLPTMPDWFLKNDRYRWVADGLFLLTFFL